MTILTLSRARPLDLTWDADAHRLALDGKPVAGEARTVGQMRSLFADFTFQRNSPGGRALYFMHRAVDRAEDRELFSSHGVRHDITVFAPGSLGREANKTFGHYHPPASLRPLRFYPEVYEVLSGTAVFILQKRKDAVSDEVAETVVVKCKAGEKALMPSGWGHVTANPDPHEPLVLANLVYPGFDSDYTLYKKHHGASYYLMRDGTLESNPSYRPASPVRKATAKAWTKGWLQSGKGLYELFLDRPEKFAFLRNPKLKV